MSDTPDPELFAGDSTPDFTMASVTVVVGFDYGARRIGVALGNRISSSARALDVVDNGGAGPDWQRIAALLREWRPDAVLVGLHDVAGIEPAVIEHFGGRLGIVPIA